LKVERWKIHTLSKVLSRCMLWFEQHYNGTVFRKKAEQITSSQPRTAFYPAVNSIQPSPRPHKPCDQAFRRFGYSINQQLEARSSKPQLGIIQFWHLPPRPPPRSTVILLASIEH
jgi:hypothetical protein